MGHAARPATLIRENETFAARGLKTLAEEPAPTDDRGAADHLARLGNAADWLFLSHQVRWQNRIGDHVQTARRVIAVAGTARGLRRRFPMAPTAYPFHRAAWLGYLAEGALDAGLLAEFPVPDDLAACRADDPFQLADGCLLLWIRTGTPHPDWEDFVGGRFRRGLPTAHLTETYQAYTEIVSAVLRAEGGRFADGVAEAGRLFDWRWRIGYPVPEGGMIGNPKARGRDVRLAALLEFARKSHPGWESVCDASPHCWRASAEAKGRPARSSGRSPRRRSRGAEPDGMVSTGDP